MHERLMRALMLAMSLLLLGAVPALAQTTEEEGWLLASEDDSVLVAVQRDIAVAPGKAADGVVIIDGAAVIEGPVEGLLGIDADITVSGATATVERMFTVGGSLTIENGATVGEVTYSDTDVSGVAAASVTGEFVDAQEELVGALATVVAVLIVLIFFLAIGVFIAILALTLLVVAFGSVQVRRAAATISNDVLKTIVVGLLAMILSSVIFWLLFITVVGIPLALMLWLLWGVVVILGWIVVGNWIGERILPRGRLAARPYGATFLGVLILLLLSWTGIVPLLATVFGTGAVTLAGWRVLRGGGVPPVPPGYGEPWGQPMMAPPPYAPPPYAPPPPPQQGQWPPQGGQPPGAWPQS